MKQSLTALALAAQNRRPDLTQVNGPVKAVHMLGGLTTTPGKGLAVGASFDTNERNPDLGTDCKRAI